MPLYKMVRQEFIPTNVDEAEFEVSVNAPEGTSLAAMDEVMQRDRERNLRHAGACGSCSASAGGGFLGGVNRAASTSASRRTRSASSRSAASGARRCKANPGNAFQRQLHAARRDAGGPRARCASYTDLRIAVRNAPSFNIGGGNFDIDFVLRGPDLESARRIRRAALRERAPRDSGIVDADTTLKLDKPELRVEIDRERAADLGVDTEDIATALRLMVGGDDEVSRFRDRASTKTTTCSCA